MVFVISFYVDYNQKQVYRKLSGLVLGGLCAYVSIPPWQKIFTRKTHLVLFDLPKGLRQNFVHEIMGKTE